MGLREKIQPWEKREGILISSKRETKGGEGAGIKLLLKELCGVGGTPPAALFGVLGGSGGEGGAADVWGRALLFLCMDVGIWEWDRCGMLTL